MSRFWSDTIRDLEPYVPGEQPKGREFIKLNTNESPVPPSPKVIEALNQHDKSSLRRYPDPNASELKAAIAKNFDLEQNQVFVGNGSDEVLALAFMAFFRGQKRILFPAITYSFYPVYCDLFQVQYQAVTLTDSFEINTDDYKANNGGVIIANPNAPTGIALNLGKIEQLVADNPDAVVLIDEAYVDFGAESAVSLVNQYPNLLVVHTLSKSRGLAGLRVGYALGNNDLIEGLERVKNSFNCYPMDSLAICGAVASFEDVDYFERSCQDVTDTRNWLSEQLRALGFSVLPSKANFVFVSSEKWLGAELYLKLREQGVLVRHFKRAEIENYLRISIGTREEVAALVELLKKI